MLQSNKNSAHSPKLIKICLNIYMQTATPTRTVTLLYKEHVSVYFVTLA